MCALLISVAVFALLTAGCGAGGGSGDSAGARSDGDAMTGTDGGTAARSDGSAKGGRDAGSTARLEEIAALLREGDVVFRRGGGLVSRAVLAADRGGVYSHVGVVARVAGALMVVHVVPGEPDSLGVQDVMKIETPLEFFAPRKAGRGAVMRLRDIDTADGGMADGSAYDMTGGADGNAVDSSANGAKGGMEDGMEDGSRSDEIKRLAARAAVRLAEAGVPFDHGYDLADTARMYCTEFVWHVFRGAGVDLSGGRRTRVGLPGMGGTYIMPSDIAAAPELEPVCRF